MMNTESCLPPDLQPIADAVLKDFAAGVEEPDGLTQICEWLEIDGWDFLIADLGEQNALKLGYIAQLEFTDEEARYNLDIPEEVEIQDTDRLSWARQRINYAEAGDDTYLLASLHAYRLNGSDESFAFVGCLIEVHGQGGPVCEWWGLWEAPEEFYDAVGEGGYNWVTPRMGQISDQVILSMWQKPKRRGKNRAK
jgi:hypothetical protein